MKTGTLYIVATPIGNLDDISERAVETLKKVDVIASEDTRHSTILLKHYDIRKKQISYYDKIEEQRSAELISRLISGENVALVSDAGTPGLSDPGYRLITMAIDEGIAVVPIPGASSILTALVTSGLPTDRFCFEGFLPRKKGRETRLKELSEESRTMVIFESPFRVVKTLEDLLEYFGDRRAACCREMTKVFEEFRRDRLSGLIRHFKTVKPKGEFVIVVEGKRHKKSPVAFVADDSE